jgi:DNA mismatch endonuclease (patch repair protein)
VKSVPGKPDIVMRKYRTAIFVNGCFWHGHFVELGVGSVECGVRSVECGVRSVECGVRSAELGVRGAELGVRGAELGVRGAELGVRGAELGVDSCQGIVDSSCCKIPQTNREFWVNKIKRNQERDQRNYQVLHDNGWQVIVVWECQLAPKCIEETMLRVELLLNENFLALHQSKVVPYPILEDDEVPMAAEGASYYGL